MRTRHAVPYRADMARSSSLDAKPDRMGFDRITLGPFELTDASGAQLVSALVQQLNSEQKSTRPIIMFSLHVAGLNLRGDSDFCAALRRADLVVPDGISVAALARIAGASGLHRHPTTDIGWELLAAFAAQLQRPVKVALIGGGDGLAVRAGKFMNQRNEVDVVYTEHGYHDDWSDVLAQLNQLDWDVLVVGMGMPTEAFWVDRHLEQLQGSLVLTCGGWFSHIVGDEKRAPIWMRRVGLEWVARLVQQPTRLVGRYATGLLSTVAMIPTALACRTRRCKTQTQQNGVLGDHVHTS